MQYLDAIVISVLIGASVDFRDYCHHKLYNAQFFFGFLGLSNRGNV